ncbi:RNA polymerase ii transcription factor b subunit 5 [Colletotrichum musicola]|uniref:General transcription and DNA repair factor IIH subunit TFB5 n=1 Tax=Colletotrichum musicola TaxID=2175873 RepID=A0A8H6U9M0_9PEZI|nr:RNA polymerase ii transcription factor b subunit 5 [Colletotrichum musicola]
MPRAIRGVLIECDPSIKSIIVNIDAANNDYIIEDLDDQHVVVKENMVADLKRRLDDVRSTPDQLPRPTLPCAFRRHACKLRHIVRLTKFASAETEGDAAA